MASTGEPYGLFWNSISGDRTYDANSFEYWLKKFFTSGVFNGDLQVQATSGMTLVVGSGYANVDGKVKFWNAEFNLTLSPANSTYPRIDTVVITRDNVNRNITCEVVTGAYSGDTPQPTAPVRTAEIYQLVLAQIYVGNGVTEITQANITDTRPDTTLCGWITGTVTEMDFSQFVAQFESYFAQFKSQHEHDWSVWEQTQVAAYNAWFDNVKAEQIADKADWDAWYAALQEELHNLPADSAEYLQIQIDEIRENGTTGSIFHITTTNTELEGKTVTVSCGSEVKTATFDANLECTVIGFKSVGAVTITSTDGIQTATKILDIDYYSKYEVPIAFWSATVNIQGDDNLKGATITVKDSDDTTVATIVLNVITGQGVFSAQKADTYTFNYTFSGTDYSESLVVDEETTYSLELSAGFSWTVWVDTARDLDSSDYDSLDEVLADEKALRELFLEHACVDYMAELTSSNEYLETVINNDLCAKWINLSDYALDFLHANEVIADLMDEADKYGYGEWALMPQVPKMTSNTAPYGEVIPDVNQDSYKMFDGSTSTGGKFFNAPTGTSVTNIVGKKCLYHFSNATVIKKMDIQWGSSLSFAFDIVGGNDTTNLTTLYTTDLLPLGSYSFDIPNDTAYEYYGIRVANARVDTEGTSGNITEIQFYAWAPKGNVPVMTGDSAPYGEVNGSLSASSGSGKWKAFDGDVSTAYIGSSSATSAYVQYKFTNPVNVKAFMCYYASHNVTSTIQISYSDDGSTFTNAGDTFSYTSSDSDKKKTYKLDDDYGYHLYWRFTRGRVTAATTVVNELQFYGRELKVSVPTMTSNTAPFGEVSINGSPDTSGEAYRAFDNNESTTASLATASTTGYVQYKFVNPISIKQFMFLTKSLSTDVSLQVSYSNDGSTFTDISESFTYGKSDSDKRVIYTFSNDYGAHLYWRITRTRSTTAKVIANLVQFYGLDYSEKEFEAGTTKKWLYDHGVELVDFDSNYTGSSTIQAPEKESSQIYFSATPSTSYARVLGTSQSLDLTNNNIIMMRVGNKAVIGSSAYAEIDASSSKSLSDSIARKIIANISFPNESLDISNVNNGYIFVASGYSTRTYSFTELWLE